MDRGDAVDLSETGPDQRSSSVSFVNLKQVNRNGSVSLVILIHIFPSIQ